VGVHYYCWPCHWIDLIIPLLQLVFRQATYPLPLPHYPADLLIGCYLHHTILLVWWSVATSTTLSCWFGDWLLPPPHYPAGLLLGCYLHHTILLHGLLIGYLHHTVLLVYWLVVIPIMSFCWFADWLELQCCSGGLVGVSAADMPVTSIQTTIKNADVRCRTGGTCYLLDHSGYTIV